MTLKPFKRIPVLIAAGVIALVCLVAILRLDFLEKIERMTFDMRAREALKYDHETITNLGFIYLDEKSIKALENRLLGKPYGLHWPRHVYGRLVHELQAQGAKTIAFDVLFGGRREDHAGIMMADNRIIDSDEFFALQMERASNVVLACAEDVTPHALFSKTAWLLGDISTDKDPDGILRRARAFRSYRKWHPVFEQAQADPDLQADLESARFEPRRLTLRTGQGDKVEIPLDADGNFDMADFVGEKIPAGMARKAKPFTEQRVWHMGVVLAASQLQLDLNNPEIDLSAGRITLRGPGGLQRTIPVDSEGNFLIDWCIPPNHPKLTKEPFHSLLSQNVRRIKGETNRFRELWHGKLAVVGSSALGNDLTDRGATPLGKDTLLASKHWNVANSIITGRFVKRASWLIELALIALLGAVAAFITWQFRAVRALCLVVLLAIVFIIVSTAVYVQTRYWVPIVLPVMGALFSMHACLLAWRVVFEQAKGRRIRSIFSKVVSPKIVNELVEREDEQAAGARRQITVMFADVRGFTELTDSSQERVSEFVRQNGLTGADAEACYNEQARETLQTVNLYLGIVADIIIQRDGTLDKFIGDCVMAFWGAPIHEPRQALLCVQAAIEAQRAIQTLNQQRALENKQRELENSARVSAGLPPKQLLPSLLLGSGINTGMATVGLMGSQTQQQSYTAFGREVNLASRLEGASGRGRIFIGAATYEELLRLDPALAASCKELPPTELKGFRAAIKAYEVPWQPVAPAPAPPEAAVPLSTAEAR